MNKYTHDVVATVGEYTDSSGATKKRYTTIGRAFTDEHGKISAKLDTIPVSPEWTGWINFYPPKDREAQQAAPASRQPAEKQRHEQAKANAFQQQDDDGLDDIAF